MDDDGKGVQRLLRKRLFPLANLLCVDSQFGGGLNGGETAIAHLYLRLFVDSITFSHKSGAIVFYDVCSAFATLLRRIIFDIDQGDENWLRRLSLAGFTEDDIDHIYNFVKRSFLIIMELMIFPLPATILFSIWPRSGIPILGLVRSLFLTLPVPLLGLLLVRRLLILYIVLQCPVC